MADYGLRRRRSNNLADLLKNLELQEFKTKITTFRRIALDVTIGKIADLTAGMIKVFGTNEDDGHSILIDASDSAAFIHSENFDEDTSGFVTDGFALRSEGTSEFADVTIKELKLDIEDEHILVGRGKGNVVDYKQPFDTYETIEGGSFDSGLLENDTDINSTRLIMPEVTITDVITTDTSHAQINQIYIIDVDANIVNIRFRAVVRTSGHHDLRLYRSTESPSSRTDGTAVVQSLEVNLGSSIYESVIDETITDMGSGERFWFTYVSSTENQRFSSIQINGDFSDTTQLDEEGAISGTKIDYFQETEPSNPNPFEIWGDLNEKALKYWDGTVWEYL